MVSNAKIDDTIWQGATWYSNLNWANSNLTAGMLEIQAQICNWRLNQSTIPSKHNEPEDSLSLKQKQLHKKLKMYKY